MRCEHNESTYARRGVMWTIYCHGCGVEGPMGSTPQQAERRWEERHGTRPYRRAAIERRAAGGH